MILYRAIPFGREGTWAQYPARIVADHCTKVGWQLQDGWGSLNEAMIDVGYYASEGMASIVESVSEEELEEFIAQVEEEPEDRGN